jgi:hypothetical protein
VGLVVVESKPRRSVPIQAFDDILVERPLQVLLLEPAADEVEVFRLIAVIDLSRGCLPR